MKSQRIIGNPDSGHLFSKNALLQIPIKMKKRYSWYECFYPKASTTFFVNIRSGKVCCAVPENDPDCHSVRELPLDMDLNDSSPFYISLHYLIELSVPSLPTVVKSPISSPKWNLLKFQSRLTRLYSFCPLQKKDGCL